MKYQTFSLNPPETNVTLLPRPRLVNKIESVSHHRLVIIHAPAGAGKSEAVKQWLQTRKEKHVWLTLNPYLNCSSFLKQELYTALCELNPQPSGANPAQINSLLTNDATMEYLLAKAVSFADNGEKYILVLQNASTINQEESVQALVLLLRYLPANFTVVITSTIAADRLPFTRGFSTTAGLVHAGDLAFTLEEANDLFVSMGKTRCKSRLRHVIQVTHGSPLSLQLFFRTMGSYVEEMRGQSAENILHIYLDNYVWPKLTAQEQSLLAQFSICYELTPELCAQITEDPDAAEILLRFYKEQPMLNFYQDNFFIFHPLMKDYFRKKLESLYDDEGIRLLFNRAGHYYLSTDTPLFATMYFEQGSDAVGYETALQQVFEHYPDISIDATQAFSNALKNINVDDSFYGRNGKICAYMAYSNFFAGNGEEFCRYMDLLKPSSRARLPGGPITSEPFPFIGASDFRQTLYDYSDTLYPFLLDKKHKDFFSFSPERTFTLFGTLLDQPLIHRSIHDYSPFLQGDTDAHFAKMTRTFDLIFGPYISTVQSLCARAGLLYEQHHLQEAYDLAFRAYDLSDKTMSNKMRFSARLIIAELLFAMNASHDAEIMLAQTQQVIDNFDDMYLLANFRAYTSRKRIENGDRQSANEWLSTYAVGLTEPPMFYRTYQNFTTLRALIATESMHNAIRLAQRMIRLAQTYHRPMDEMEAEMLLSIAHWYDDSRKSAQEHMVRALVISQKYQYTQAFINHANDVIPILDAVAKTHSLNGEGILDINALVNLRITVFNERGGENRSLISPGAYPRRIKLSKRQRQVLRLLMENATYTDIANALGIQMSTAKSHVLELYRKLGVNSSNEATSIARDFDLLGEYSD